MVTRSLPAALALATGCTFAQVAPGQQVDVRSIAHIQRSDPPYGRTPLEDKRIFDCDGFTVTDAQIRFALKNARPVSQAHWAHQAVSVGCFADVFVTFKNGERVFFSLEPTGRIFAHAESGPRRGTRLYYHCRLCEDTLWYQRPDTDSRRPR